MALTLGDNFSYQGAKPLDARLKYDTLAAMKAVVDATMYDGCMAYCSATDKTYQWKSTNTVDESTGKWREFSSGGGGGSTYTAGDGIDITNDVISTKQSEEGDIDEIVDVYPQAGNLVSIVNAFNKGDIYSTSEKMIGQWIDGKPLYQKTVLTGALQNATEKTVAHGIANIDIITYAYATINADNGEMTIVPYAVDQVEKIINQIVLTIDKTNVYYTSRYSNDKQKYTSSYCTLRYTKTTDVAISIGEATEYSTDEKVVGTWIDGKPLYQKTVELPSVSSGDNAIPISNIDYIVSSVATLNNSINIVSNTSIFFDSSHYCVGIVQKNVSTGNVVLYVSIGSGWSSWENKPWKITIQYTKTT